MVLHIALSTRALRMNEYMHILQKEWKSNTAVTLTKYKEHEEQKWFGRRLKQR